MGFFKRIIGSIYGRARSCYYLNRYESYKKKYNIKSGFRFQGTDIRFYGDGKIYCDEFSYIGTNSTIQSVNNHRVVIGKHCQISHNVRIYTSSADPNQDFTKPKLKPNKTGDVIIGNGVWIGANVFINPDITIGDNSVIGANSVVTNDIKTNTIVGGVPAKLIKSKNLNP